MADRGSVGGDVIGALSIAALLILIALGIADSMVSLLLGLLIFPLLAYAMFRLPVRTTMMALMFLAFALPNPAEGTPTDWKPPFFMLGAVFLTRLNQVDRTFSLLSGVSLSGMDLSFMTLGVILFLRRSSQSKIDSLGMVPTPTPMLQLAKVSLLATLLTWFSGLIRGGEFGISLWQVAAVIYLPIIFLLFQSGLRGPLDLRALGRVVLAAAIYKCFLAMLVIATTQLPPDPETGSTSPPYATSHNDSMLFAAAFVIILAPLIDRVTKRAIWTAVCILPILIAGTICNNRRLAWVQVALVFVTVYLVSRETPLKRTIRRSLLALVPIIVGYVVAGWNSQYGKFFKFARMARSIVDAKTDSSTEWRELENVNIIATFREHILLGTGFGHPYKEVVVLPLVNYTLEKYVPHNSLLAQWCYSGVVGYAGLTMLWVVGVYFAMRAYHNATDATQRVGALVSFGAVLIYLLQCWGDLGLNSWTGVFMMGAALATAGKLAAANGQWPLQAARRLRKQVASQPYRG